MTEASDETRRQAGRRQEGKTVDRCGVQRPVGQGRLLRCSLAVLLCGGVAALLCGCGCVAVQLWECMTGGNAEGEQEEHEVPDHALAFACSCDRAPLVGILSYPKCQSKVR